MLLFYTCEENEAVREDSIPRHMLGMYTVQRNPSFKVLKSHFCAIFAHILSKKLLIYVLIFGFLLCERESTSWEIYPTDVTLVSYVRASELGFSRI